MKSGLEPKSVGNSTKPESAQVNRKSAQVLHRYASKAKAKTSSAYWLDKVKKPAGSAMYGVQISYRGHGEENRVRFPLETADKSLAADRARERYLHLVSHGWKATLAHYKPEAVKVAKVATVGELITTATRLSSARAESLEAYAKSMRRLTAGVLGIDDGRKYDFKRGAKEWRDNVDKTPLDKLTPTAVLEWKNAFMKAAKTPEERNAAAVTINSLLRNTQALLSKKIRPFIEDKLTLPSPLWFEGVPKEKEPSLRYHSQIDAGTIISAAVAELGQAKPEVFKALLLTLLCGLRRSEADKMTWVQFDLDAGTLDIRDTEHKALKSADSAGKIGLDAELVALLRGFKARAKGLFLLETPRLSRIPFTEHRSRTYRCDATYQELIDWLRVKGVPGKRPIHILRKEIGSIIASRDGIFAASRYLRHSDIRITSKLYADTKTLVAAGLGSLLAPDNVVQGAFVKPETAETVKVKAPAMRKASSKRLA
jgi:integrase